MRWGREGTTVPGPKVFEVEDCETMLKTFLKYGHNEVDTALTYNSGTSEEYLGEIDYKSLGVVVGTKLYPTRVWGVENGVTHTAVDIEKYLEVQLKSLKTDSVDLWYLHGPDRQVPFEETLKAVDKAFHQGKFKRFGLSNFKAWEVTEIVFLCEKNGWLKPTTYQGVYNCLHRNVEPELFPAIRKLGLAFYGFNPMVGGLLTDQLTRDGPESSAKIYVNRYWKAPYWDSLDLLNPLAKKHGLTQAEIALRWGVHHSLMKKEFGDNILIGASSSEHLDSNLKDLEKGPLPEEVVEALDKGWELVKGVASNYYH